MLSSVIRYFTAVSEGPVAVCIQSGGSIDRLTTRQELVSTDGSCSRGSRVIRAERSSSLKAGFQSATAWPEFNWCCCRCSVSVALFLDHFS